MNTCVHSTFHLWASKNLPKPATDHLAVLSQMITSSCDDCEMLFQLLTQYLACEITSSYSVSKSPLYTCIHIIHEVASKKMWFIKVIILNNIRRLITHLQTRCPGHSRSVRCRACPTPSGISVSLYPTIHDL